MALPWGRYTTPLHEACMDGDLSLVQELRLSRPEFAKVQGEDRLSPLHIAAAGCDVRIVTELLELGTPLCIVKGPENKIPLHYAVIHGELAVMKKLLSVSSMSVQETTTQKETALHLALKYKQFDAVIELVKHLTQHKMEQEINRKDSEGNTALHLAAAAANFEVVRFMLRLQQVVVDVNAYNNNGETPLDYLPRGAGNGQIRKILARAGAIPGRGRASSLVSEVNQSNGSNRERESTADKRNALLVVAALIANATYQSVLQPPHFTTKVPETHTAGFFAFYASWMTGPLGRDLAYIFFISGNTFGFLVSVLMIIYLTKDLPIKLPMLLSMALMVQSYLGHTFYLPFTSLEKEICLKNVELLSVLPLAVPILLLLFLRPLAQGLECYLEELSLFDHIRDMFAI